MSEHFRAFSAVFPLLLREKEDRREVLLHLRQNTGYMDGRWDTAGSGHVEEWETAVEAAIREAKEELGIVIKSEDVSFAHVCHDVRKSDDLTYYNLYFFIRRYEGVPAIREPEKCVELAWFDVTDLPEGIIDVRRQALEDCLNGITYREYKR